MQIQMRVMGWQTSYNPLPAEQGRSKQVQRLDLKINNNHCLQP